MIHYAFIILCSMTLLILGIREKIKNDRNVKQLSIRVNVNGIRGKSTATRLITSILHEAGYSVIGKTTGSAARFIIPAEGKELEIPRRPEGPNIKEQMKTIRRSVEYGADALVCECMAVRPEYQNAYQNQMFKANITVIVNVLEDHLDVMGPTLDEIAKAFSCTIPINGYLIINNSPYVNYFTQIANERNTKVFIANTDDIPEGYLDEFDYLLFPDNVALGLAFAQSLGIKKNIALEGMLNAAPDPGALRITYLDRRVWRDSVFVNGFAANEPESSLKIWEMIMKMDDLPLDSPLIIFNGRPDRVDRTRQFVADFFPHLQNVTLIGMGQAIQSIQDAMNKGRFPGISEYLHWEDMAPKEIVDNLRKIMNRRLLLGVGNIHGDVHEFLEYLLHENPGEDTAGSFPVPDGGDAQILVASEQCNVISA